ncbi:GLPGLI family protein [Joostella sp. CR20]|uniref:GLPGLI family protein n=1 Tax=Joostella sp. CR20 TaxID=2804312 RepID=UPI00313B0B44
MKWVFVVFCIVAVNVVFSQKSMVVDELKYECKYLLTYQPDSTSAENKRSEIMLLQIGKTTSKFISEGMKTIDSVSKEMASNQVGSIDVGAVFSKIPRTKIKEIVYKNHPINKISVIEIVARDHYLYEEDLKKLNWKILADTKEINGQQCQKATLNYGGRNYEAWFSKEIPISEGPYKFNGLPGLIVFMKDEKEHYKYELIAVSSKNNQSIYFENDNFIKLTKSEFHEQKKKFYENFLLNAQNSGLTLKFDNPNDRKKLQSKLKNNNNNPIELKFD